MERRCYLRKHRVTPCRKQRCAPFPARLELPGATRGPALLPSPELPWDSEQEPGASGSPTPDHQISCFAPERIYVVRHPCAGWSPLRSDSYGGPADAGRWTGQVHQPQDGCLRLLGRLATRFLTTHPGRPVPTPDPKVTFGASTMK